MVPYLCIQLGLHTIILIVGKFYALVQFTQETHAKKLLTISTKVNTSYRLKFYEWKYEVDSKDKASMEHDIDGLLMYFGFLGSPEKFRYLSVFVVLLKVLIVSSSERHYDFPINLLLLFSF